MPAGGEDAARRFDAGLLGLTEIPKPDVLRSRGGVWFEPGLHLGVEEAFAPARKAHPAIAVDDLDEVAGRLATAGRPVAWNDRLPGQRRFHTGGPVRQSARATGGDVAHNPRGFSRAARPLRR